MDTERTPAEKLEIHRNFARAVSDRYARMLMHIAENAPEDWDGFEMRWILTHVAAQFEWKDRPDHRARKRRFLLNMRDGDMLAEANNATKGE